jgi:hypothetical protein
MKPQLCLHFHLFNELTGDVRQVRQRS